MIDTDEIILKPFIMLVEDRKDARDKRASFFKKMGCSVITAENAMDALKLFMISPQLDLICTDIDLLGDEYKNDKSGVSIARFVKQLNHELPVIGYSSKFEDRELNAEEKSYFDKWYSKKGKSTDEYELIYDNIIDVANTHKQKRIDEVIAIFNNLKGNGIINSNFSEVLSIALSFIETPIEQINEAISDNGYELKLISHDKTIKKPFLIWLRKDNNFYEVEIYGYPSLYSYGQTEDEAINNLIFLMKSFALDMLEEDEENILGPALNLKKFLFHTLNLK